MLLLAAPVQTLRPSKTVLGKVGSLDFMVAWYIVSEVGADGI